MISTVNLRQQVQQLAARGRDLTEVRTELDRLLRAAVGYDVGALSTMDPATKLWTSCFVSGLPLDGGDRARERIIFDIEFKGNDVNSYGALSHVAVPVGRLAAATDGDITKAERYGPLLSMFGVRDEMRVVLRSGDACWGSLTLYRAGPGDLFSERDESVVADAVAAIAELFRLTLLRAALAAPRGVEQPPGLLLMSSDGSVRSASAAADAWLDAIDDRDRLPSAIHAVCAAVTAGDGLARASLPARDGRWVVLHGSPVIGESAVAIIIEGARPYELSEVIAGAYGFTPREREITALAAQGRTTKQIAHSLAISPFTVQDHLKAVFAKTGVQTRGELVATISAQHYEPRSDAGVMPSPYGWYLDDEVPNAS